MQATTLVEAEAALSPFERFRLGLASRLLPLSIRRILHALICDAQRRDVRFYDLP